MSEEITPTPVAATATAATLAAPSPNGNGKPQRVTIARVQQFLQEADYYLERVVRDTGIGFDDCPRGAEAANMLGTIGEALPGAVQIAFVYPGATAPFYRTEPEFRYIRAQSRVFCQSNAYVIGALRNFCDYVVGDGHTYQISPRDLDGVKPQTVADCRKRIDDFCKRNKWPQRQTETVRRYHRDGEVFRRYFVDEKKGELNVRFVEPLEIQNPPGKSSFDGCYFGIDFKEVEVGDSADDPQQVGKVYDCETPISYNLVNIGTLGECISLREVVLANLMQHLKANVDLNWPRGMPTFYALQPHLENVVKILKSTLSRVDFLARIAMIRRHINGAKESVQKFLENARNASDPNDPRQVRTAGQYPHSSIIDAPDSTEYQFPAGDTPVDGNVKAMQAELRAAAAALSMPEYMLSANAENNAYSSTLVAEGPAVKSFEKMQADLIEADVEILDLQLVIAAKAGLITDASGDPDAKDYILDLVRIEAEPPIVKHELSLEESQADQIIQKAGAMSKSTFAARHKLVYSDEKIQIQAEAEADAKFRADMQAKGYVFAPFPAR